MLNENHRDLTNKMSDSDFIGVLGVTNVSDVAMTITVATVSLYLMMGLGVYLMCPSLILQVYFKFAVLWSGMKVKFASPDGKFHFCYGEKGHQREGSVSLLLLHGFTADHFMWTPVVKRIPSSVHVIAMDSPGHGGSSEPEEGDLDYSSQVKMIRQFVELIGLDKQPFHIVGLSMGAALGGLFAAEYPQLVKKLTLSCPSMITPTPSPFAAELRQHHEDGRDFDVTNCILLPQNGAEVQEMLNFSRFYKTYFPYQILQGAADIRKKKNDFYLKLFLCITHQRNTLEDNLEKVKVPVQLIWGKEDKIIDLSGIDALKTGLSKVDRVDIIPECGHAITLDQPETYTQVIMDYWAGRETTHT
ncbi:monoacylglycerol lipase ABHD6-like [Haliotis rufescens]|uniref:monoacylglycerol lipase ABHD6-like n=1 Tax=Haliotis rufescens TaxID=6454 RepID=UPI001EB093EB|nr:monoacylglycerol lipase ABHD6-like [Haliotis rufescens]XP_046380418.1 monoacylglycerol lipase ABHD6-like [Haliotis rufescens]